MAEENVRRVRPFVTHAILNHDNHIYADARNGYYYREWCMSSELTILLAQQAATISACSQNSLVLRSAKNVVLATTMWDIIGPKFDVMERNGRSA
jgi:hypothetical protein